MPGIAHIPSEQLKDMRLRNHLTETSSKYLKTCHGTVCSRWKNTQLYQGDTEKGV